MLWGCVCCWVFFWFWEVICIIAVIIRCQWSATGLLWTSWRALWSLAAAHSTSHPFIVPFIYLLLHIKQKCLILKCLLTEGKKGSFLILAAAFLCQVIPSVSLIYKWKLVGTAWNGGVESKDWQTLLVQHWQVDLGNWGTYTHFQQCALVQGWLASYHLAIGNVLD